MKFFFAYSLVVILFCGFPAYADTHHLYVSGHLTSRTDHTVTIGKETFSHSELTKIVVLLKENGAFFEMRGSRSDLREGAPVTVKVLGNEVEEIIVERWKE